MRVRILVGAIFLFTFASFPLAQQTTGSLKGTVTDQLGSLVVGAKVTMRNARGAVTSATTNSSGVYEFRRLGAGTYEFQVFSPGFNVFEEKKRRDSRARAEDLRCTTRSCI
jgi:hypothetical protein